MRPLYIVLHGRYFDAFKAGEKTIEYRRNSGRFTVQACRPGRSVILQRAYTKIRLSAVIAGVVIVMSDGDADLREFFGPGVQLVAISLIKIAPLTSR